MRKATEDTLVEATGRKGTVSMRFTHVYPDGPAVYYTFNVRGDPGRLIEQWRHIKTRASDALIATGGTITHHHAVGRDHMPWYRAQRPDLFGKAFAAAKGALYPAGIMNPGVLIPRAEVADWGETRKRRRSGRQSFRPLVRRPGRSNR